MEQSRLTRAQAESYIARFASARVLVLGDIMLDRYFWGQVDRISPEAPVPVVRVDRKSARLGGAANVAANLRGLGTSVALAGIIGDDHAGTEMRRLLGEHSIDGQHVLVDTGRETTEKVRIIAQNQQVVRADFETDAAIRSERTRELAASAAAEAGTFDALIISDYGKGVIHPDYLRDLISAWRDAGKPVLVDPHVGHFRWYEGATVVTPNTKEAASFFGGTVEAKDLFETRAFDMRRELGFDALLITRGEHGMTLFEDGTQTHIPTVAKEVYDVTGAGDTVISTLGAALAVGTPLRDAVVLANLAAGEAVKEIGTTAVAADKIVTGYI
jgi:D-beta-D-heptose 7-phosphate kinase/D-beta-D-heptose 1-phosphate adenosyltransferase